MNATRRFSVPGALTFWMTLCLAASPNEARTEEQAAPQTAYEKWVQLHGSAQQTGRDFGASDGAERVERDLKVKVTMIEGDDREEAAAARGERFAFTPVSSHGSEVLSNWRAYSFRHHAFGSSGGGYFEIPDADRKRLAELLAHLPDDGARLPPAGRRLVVHAPDKGQWRPHVYDRANIPKAVLEVLRLIGSAINAWVPQFESTHVLHVSRSAGDVSISVSPDGQSLFSSASHGPLTCWNPKTRTMLRELEIPDAVSAPVFSPDGSLAVVKVGWGMCQIFETTGWTYLKTLSVPEIEDRQPSIDRPVFTPDGRFLLLQTSEPRLRIYDTVRWSRQDSLADIPTGALAYFSARKRHHAVMLTRSARVVIWDTDGRREHARLDDEARIQAVAFSPDESQVAVATNHRGPKDSADYWSIYRLRIWDVATGKLLHELHPYERSIHEIQGELVWSPDGMYILAAAKVEYWGAGGSVHIWNAKTGRNRGDLTDRSNGAVNLTLMPGGHQLAAGCRNGAIEFWDLATILDEVRKFEATLEIGAVEVRAR